MAAAAFWITFSLLPFCFAWGEYFKGGDFHRKVFLSSISYVQYVLYVAFPTEEKSRHKKCYLHFQPAAPPAILRDLNERVFISFFFARLQLSSIDPWERKKSSPSSSHILWIGESLRLFSSSRRHNSLRWLYLRERSLHFCCGRWNLLEIFFSLVLIVLVSFVWCTYLIFFM